MKLRYHKVVLVSVIAGAVAGCASQGGQRNGDMSPLCAAVGGVIGGGTAAAITIAAGPIGAGVGVGALIGALACQHKASQNVAVAQVSTAAPAPAPAPMAEVADPDSDGDGVADRLDRCPDTPSGTRVDAQGCPDVLLTLTGINFRFDSAEIDPSSAAILEQAMATLASTSNVYLRVEGHCDSIGTDEYNLALSARRAQAVTDYLVAHGFARSRLTVVGKGEAEPVAPNDTEQGRAANRRVEFRVEHGAAASDAGAETWRDVDHSVSTGAVDTSGGPPR